MEDGRHSEGEASHGFLDRNLPKKRVPVVQDEL